MAETQHEKITDRYIDSEIDDSILEFSVQEIISLYAEVLKILSENENDEKMNERKQNVFKSVVIRLMRSEKIYIAYHVMTGYPYIDIKGNAWIFSEKEFSREAHHHYIQQGIPLTMKKLEGEQIAEEVLELARIGAGTVILDNGQQSVQIYLDDIMKACGISGELSTSHPELMLNILASMELSYASDGKHPALPAGDKVIKELISKSHLLVPVKLEHHLEDGESMKITTETTSQIALVNPLNQGRGLVPAFTDWKEFTKLYSKDEWNAVIFDYETLKDAASNADGIMINPSGVMFVIPNSAA